MAYVDFSMGLPGASKVARNAAIRLSALEWAAVAVARHDHLSTLHHPSRLGRALSWLFDVANGC
jgi:hypothetical protein